MFSSVCNVCVFLCMYTESKEWFLVCVHKPEPTKLILIPSLWYFLFWALSWRFVCLHFQLKLYTLPAKHHHVNTATVNMPACLILLYCKYCWAQVQFHRDVVCRLLIWGASLSLKAISCLTHLRPLNHLQVWPFGFGVKQFSFQCDQSTSWINYLVFSLQASRSSLWMGINFPLGNFNTPAVSDFNPVCLAIIKSYKNIMELHNLIIIISKTMGLII